MKTIIRPMLLLATAFCSQQANAILMATQGDAPESDPATATATTDQAETSRVITSYGLDKATGATLGAAFTSTTNTDLYYFPFTYATRLGEGLITYNLTLSYGSNNTVFKAGGTTTGGISDTTVGASYFRNADGFLTRANFSVKLGTGEFNDQLGSESTDFVASYYGRKSLGRYGVSFNAGYILRGEGPFDTQWGDSYIVKGTGEMLLGTRTWVGLDVTHNDTEASTGGILLNGVKSTDIGAYVEHSIEGIGIYARVVFPAGESYQGLPAMAVEPERDTTFSIGLSSRY